MRLVQWLSKVGDLLQEVLEEDFNKNDLMLLGEVGTLVLGIEADVLFDQSDQVNGRGIVARHPVCSGGLDFHHSVEEVVHLRFKQVLELEGFQFVEDALDFFDHVSQLASLVSGNELTEVLQDVAEVDQHLLHQTHLGGAQ